MAKRTERGRTSHDGRAQVHAAGGEETRGSARQGDPEELAAGAVDDEGGEAEATRGADEPSTSAVEDEGADDADARHAEDLANAAQEEIAALRDQLLRLAADFDNYRKRSLREQKEARDFGTTAILHDVLPVLDNLDRAIAHSENDEHPVAQGVRLVAKQFHEILTKHGVKPFSSLGAPFDPERHEAVAQVPTADKQPGTVIEELQRGYTLKDRLLRPARVVVATAPATGEGKPD